MGKWNGRWGHPEFDSHGDPWDWFKVYNPRNINHPCIIGMLGIPVAWVHSETRIQESNDTELADFEATLSAMDAVGRELDGIKTVVVGLACFKIKKSRSLAPFFWGWVKNLSGFLLY